jgi:hypothetical protein
LIWNAKPAKPSFFSTYNINLIEPKNVPKPPPKLIITTADFAGLSSTKISPNNVKNKDSRAENSTVLVIWEQCP